MWVTVEIMQTRWQVKRKDLNVAWEKWRMNFLVTLMEWKEDLTGEFSWTSKELNSVVFGAHSMYGTGKVSLPDRTKGLR